MTPFVCNDSSALYARREVLQGKNGICVGTHNCLRIQVASFVKAFLEGSVSGRQLGMSC